MQNQGWDVFDLQVYNQWPSRQEQWCLSCLTCSVVDLETGNRRTHPLAWGRLLWFFRSRWKSLSFIMLLPGSRAAQSINAARLGKKMQSFGCFWAMWLQLIELFYHLAVGQLYDESFSNHTLFYVINYW